MKISEIFKKKTVFSIEVFPPKKTSSVETIYKALEEYKDIKPDFISVTYGAGGSAAGASTLDIASTIKNKYGIESMAHLTCINNTRDEVGEMLDAFRENGIENILALRGDVNPDIAPKTDFRYANELVEFIKTHGDFGISGACYPEGHVEADDLISDILFLKRKVDAGAQHLVSQLFFDNSLFYAFRERAEIAGINVPIEAGIMPVTNTKQIERMVSMCGASLPSKFSKIMQRYENHPEALMDAGIAYAIDQIVDLISHGVDGIHLYSMNNPYIAKKIHAAIGSMLEVH